MSCCNVMTSEMVTKTNFTLINNYTMPAKHLPPEVIQVFLSVSM